MKRHQNRLLPLALSLALLLGLLPTTVFAATEGPPCENHLEHTADCGYTEAAEGAPCKHELGQHDAACGWSEGTPEIPCGLGCADTDGDGAIDHAEGCAYAPAAAGAPCGHVEHDGTCGYVAAVAGHDCGHACDLCAALDSGTVPGTSGQSGQKQDGGSAPLSAPSPGGADEAVGAFTVSGGAKDTDYSYENNTLTILTGTALTIQNTDTSQTAQEKIVVTNEVEANLTLAGVNIDVSSTSGACAFDITGATVTLTLADGSDNILKSGYNRAGLEAPEGSKLTINGSGKLEVTGGYESAGIGGGTCGGGGAITISGGTVTATSGGGGAGIGGGHGGDDGGDGGGGGTITISNGTVTATGLGGAGIGGGAGEDGGDGGIITISGGTVKAKGGNSAGIGGGTCGFSGDGGDGGIITISGGNVEATGGNGAGVGGAAGVGAGGIGGIITISGSAKVIAMGGSGAGIGGGNGGGDGGIIIISGSAQVEATGVAGAGIGGGYGSGIGGGDGGKIQIYGNATVTAVSSKSTGIGGGSGGSGGGGDGGKIQIYENATVTATGGNGAGIGGCNAYNAGVGGTIAIQDNAVVFATGSGGADHIGGGYSRSSASVTDSGTVNKTGGVIFAGTVGEVYGDVTLPGDLTIPGGFTLEIPGGKTLVNGHTLTNNGEIKGSGILTGDGVFSGTGVYATKVTRAIDAPTAAGVTKTSVTLNAVSPKGDGRVEYARSDTDAAPAGGWQTSPTFDGLSTGTTYYFFARVTGDTIYLDAISDGAPIKTASGGGGGGSSYSTRTLTDKTTGIVVKGNQLHGSASLTVQAGALHNAGDAGCDLLRTAQAAERVLGAWDVSLSRAFQGSVTVSLPVEGRDGQTLTVAHCISGKLTLSNVTVKQGFAAVTVDELSPFAVLNDTYTLETLAAPVAGNSFTDVKEADWFYHAALYADQHGLMNGTAAATFDPQGAVTRAQPPVVLYRLEDSPALTGQNPFADVAPGQWYADGITWAAGAGLVDGYHAATYGPGDPVTREQLVTILYRYAQYKGWDVSTGEDTNILSYADAADISEWAVPAFQWACGAGIIDGTTAGRLAPNAGATRAELAQMLMRFLENM